MTNEHKNLVIEIAKQVMIDVGQDKETYLVVHDYLRSLKGVKSLPLTRKKLLKKTAGKQK